MTDVNSFPTPCNVRESASAAALDFFARVTRTSLIVSYFFAFFAFLGSMVFSRGAKKYFFGALYKNSDEDLTLYQAMYPCLDHDQLAVGLRQWRSSTRS